MTRKTPSRILAAALLGAALAGCTTASPVYRQGETGPSGPCTPDNSISVYCP